MKPARSDGGRKDSDGSDTVRGEPQVVWEVPEVVGDSKSLILT